MSLPGWGTAAGVWSGLLWRFLDPVQKKERLKRVEKKLLNSPLTYSNSRNLERVREQLREVEREIERRASS